MNDNDQSRKPFSSKRKSLFRRGRQKENEINEFRVGDIATQDPVIIGKKAAIAGNVSAPLIRIMGVVFGSVTGTTVQISEKGQVWGDVFASEMLIEVGGKVHGWVSTFDVGTLELIQSGALSANDVLAINLAAQKDDLSELRKIAGLSSKYEKLTGETNLFQKFQVESGADTLSRKELELAMYDPNAELLMTDTAAGHTSNKKDPLSADGPLWNSVNLVVIRDELIQAKDELQKMEVEIKQLEAALAESNRLNEQSELREQERNRGYPWQDVERYRLLVEERDLFKERFQKLALWVHKNQHLLKRSQ
jgi:hypothetical protein